VLVQTLNHAQSINQPSPRAVYLLSGWSLLIDSRVCVCVVCTDDKLYIVMELIEGATLAEHFASLKEKRQQFTESRIWNIFLQVGHERH